MHEFQASQGIQQEVPSQAPPPTDSKALLLTHMTKRAALPPGDLQHVLSSSLNKSAPSANNQDVNINGKVFRQVSMARTIYTASDHRTVR
jgi:hypothetical protein